MRDLNQPEAPASTPPPDPLVGKLGVDGRVQASPAFKAALRQRLTARPLLPAEAAPPPAGRLRNLSLAAALGIGLWWLARPAGEPASAPPAAPAAATAAPTEAPARPTAMTLVTPAPAALQPAATAADTVPQAPRRTAPAAAPVQPAVAAPPTAFVPGASAEKPRKDPRLLPTAEPTATASEPQLPPEPPTATAQPAVDFPTRTPEAPLAPPAAPLDP